jgi:mannose-1-phosphate guanylyltransferase
VNPETAADRPVRDAMIVAGGAGTRLWPLTATTPKPMLPFCGEPFLAGVVARLAGAGIDRVLLIVGADASPFEPLRPYADALGVELEHVPEPEPLDTAGGVRSALDRVRGTFLVLNGDILTDLDPRAPIAAHRAAGAAATLALTRVDDTSAYGVCVLDGTRITGFVEKPAPGTLPGQDTVNAGTYVLEPDALARFPAGRLSFERTVFPELVADGAHVEGMVHEGVWADLGTPERYLDGHRLALRGALSWPSLTALPLAGSNVRAHPTADVASSATIEGPVQLSASSRVGPGAHVGPDVVLGPDVEVAADARVRRSVLGPGTRVAAGAELDGVITGTGSVVAAGARLQGPVVLGDGAATEPEQALEPGATLPASEP